jgi:hypothetical protein
MVNAKPPMGSINLALGEVIIQPHVIHPHLNG